MSAPESLSQRMLLDVNELFDFVNFHPTEVVDILNKIEALRKYSNEVASLEAQRGKAQELIKRWREQFPNRAWGNTLKSCASELEEALGASQR